MNCCPCWLSSKRKTGGYVDGGQGLHKRGGGAGVYVEIYIRQTDQELEEDWENLDNKYGRIKGNVRTPIEDHFKVFYGGVFGCDTQKVEGFSPCRGCFV